MVMADESPNLPAKPPLSPCLVKLRNRGGRPKRCVPTREQVLQELWGTKKITVARVRALELLLKELSGANPETALSTAPAKVPSWMTDQAAE